MSQNFLILFSLSRFLATIFYACILSNLWSGGQHECQYQQEGQRQQESQKEKPANVETPAIEGMSVTTDTTSSRNNSSSRNASKQQECRNSTDPSTSVKASKRWTPVRAGNSSNTQEGPHKKESLRNQRRRASRGMLQHQECQQQQDKISSGTPSSGLPHTADASNSRNVSNSITASN
jgi:hypothetical protein